MAAGVNDKFKKLTNNFSTTLNGAIVGSGDTSMSLSSTTNLPTDTGIVLVVDRVNASGTPTPTLREYIRGTVSGGTVINLVRGIGNSTAQAHLSGAVVEQVVDQTTINDIVDGLLASHDQTGALLPAAVITALGTGNLANTGFNALGQTFSSVVYNGNRSYTCTVSGTDVTNVLSPGMRLRTTRTVAAPTQSTALNGTTQFWSKTSPTGMTFTDNFTISAWIKPTAYGTVPGRIVTRVNNAFTQGFDLSLETSGQISIEGLTTTAGTNKRYTSYQSVPLNKWTHIAASLNMAGSIGVIYFDGVAVPTTNTGTATAIIQAGDLIVGNYTGGAQYFIGKIAQAAVFSAILPQSTIQSYISQGLAGTEPNLVSAYSFNGSANDLNTTNANNLTANGSVTATAADSPFGGQASGLISSTLDYGIVQATAFSTNTTVTVQVPEGCTIPTGASPLSAVVYSSNKVPYGFPSQQEKHELVWATVGNASAMIASSIASAWGKIVNTDFVLPVGVWDLRDNVTITGNSATAANFALQSQWDSATPLVNRMNQHIERVNSNATSFLVARGKHMETIDISSLTTFALYAAMSGGSGAQTAYIDTIANGTSYAVFKNAYL